jgi:hypothetical protein
MVEKKHLLECIRSDEEDEDPMLFKTDPLKIYDKLLEINSITDKMLEDWISETSVYSTGAKKGL